MAKLTDRVLDKLDVAAGQRDRMVFDTLCPGLGVRVTAKGTKVFVVQWTDPATKRKVREPLGVWGGLTLDQARAAARARLGDVAKGVNPRVERIKAKAEADRAKKEEALTLDRLISDWAALHLADRRPGYRDEATRALRVTFNDRLSKPAARLEKSDVINRLDRLISADKSTTAARVQAYGRAAFNWAMKRGKVAGNPFADLPIATPASERERVLTDAETWEIWQTAPSLGTPVGQFYRLALLTLARRDEVASLRWSEISMERAQWVIPGARTKNGKAHVIHLSEAALEVLRTIPRVKDQDLVFSTTGKTPISGFSKFKSAIDAAIVAERAKVAKEAGEEAAPLAPWVFHDFRRTGVSTLAAFGFDSIVVDKLLNHQPAKLRGVASVYQRHEFGPERARALDAWAAFVVGDPSSGAGNVSPFRKAAAA